MHVSIFIYLFILTSSMRYQVVVVFSCMHSKHLILFSHSSIHLNIDSVYYSTAHFVIFSLLPFLFYLMLDVLCLYLRLNVIQPLH